MIYLKHETVSNVRSSNDFTYILVFLMTIGPMWHRESVDSHVVDGAPARQQQKNKYMITKWFSLGTYVTSDGPMTVLMTPAYVAMMERTTQARNTRASLFTYLQKKKK